MAAGSVWIGSLANLPDKPATSSEAQLSTSSWSGMMLTLVPDAIEDYARAHSVTDPPARVWLREATYARMRLPQMLSGPLVGQTLKTLTALSGGRLAVEVGTFTGYASSWIAEGLTASGRLITCDVDSECTALGQEAWNRMGQSEQIELRLGPALETLKDLDDPIDFIFIDADKANYGILRPSSAQASTRRRHGR